MTLSQITAVTPCSSGRWNYTTITVILTFISMLFGCVLIGCLAWHHNNTWITAYPLLTAQAIVGMVIIIIALYGVIVIILEQIKLTWIYCILNVLVMATLLGFGGTCMSVSSASLMSHLEDHWQHASNTDKTLLQNDLNCCGLNYPNLQQNYTAGHPPCGQLQCCSRSPGSACCTGMSYLSSDTCPCQTCRQPLQTPTIHAVRVSGSLCLIAALFLLFSTGYTVKQTLKDYRRKKHEASQVPQDDIDDATVNYQRF